MINIKKTLTKIMTSLVPVELTTGTGGITAGTNANLGNSHFYKMGNICIVTLNLQITASISSGAALVNGLPKAKQRTNFATAQSGSTRSAGMRIMQNATSITADGAISSNGYYDGFFFYEIA